MRWKIMYAFNRDISFLAYSILPIIYNFITDNWCVKFKASELWNELPADVRNIQSFNCLNLNFESIFLACVDLIGVVGIMCYTVL